jgi:hypothetical protein
MSRLSDVERVVRGLALIAMESIRLMVGFGFL